METNNTSEAAKIVELIKKSGISVRKLAKELGIPDQRIYGWTNKGAQPKYEDIQALKKFFGIDKQPENIDKYIITVLVDRVAQLLADLSEGRSSKIVEAERILREARSLAELHSSP